MLGVNWEIDSLQQPNYNTRRLPNERVICIIIQTIEWCQRRTQWTWWSFPTHITYQLSAYICSAQSQLDEKQKELDEVQAKFDAAMQEKQELLDDAESCRRKMTAATQLIEGRNIS